MFSLQYHLSPNNIELSVQDLSELGGMTQTYYDIYSIHIDIHLIPVIRGRSHRKHLKVANIEPVPSGRR